MLVSDHGTEFTSNAILAWSKDPRVEWYCMALGEPMQNGYIESFNERMRDEPLNGSLFFGLDHARSAIARMGGGLQHSEASFLARITDLTAFAEVLTTAGYPVADPRLTALPLDEKLVACRVCIPIIDVATTRAEQATANAIKPKSSLST